MAEKFIESTDGGLIVRANAISLQDQNAQIISFYERGLSISAIAMKVGLCAATVRMRLMKAGVARRHQIKTPKTLQPEPPKKWQWEGDEASLIAQFGGEPD